MQKSKQFCFKLSFTLKQSVYYIYYCCFSLRENIFYRFPTKSSMTIHRWCVKIGAV